MVNENLQKKIERAIKLLKSASYNGGGKEIEVAYSGGKDSDVILQLTKEAGIPYRAIYKNTTIDPPGTLQHVKQMGVDIITPDSKMTKENGDCYGSFARDLFYTKKGAWKATNSGLFNHDFKRELEQFFETDLTI